MGETVRLRSTTSRVVGVASMVLAATGVGTLVASQDWDRLVTYGAVLALVALAGWMAFWSAYVEVSDGGVTLRNVLRTVVLPWPSIREVEGRYGLRLRTAYGRYDAWAATAPAGRDRLGGAESEASAVVTRRLEELRRAGHLDDPRLEHDRAQVRWHVLEIATALVICSVGVVAALLR
ncbi:MAG TPA: PH domain-containing protein [Nocardioidaceae bacterium]|nr:PH domain-containing protein [Nocardioidaceae bacterium]